jgi:hypothetical protein
MGNRKYTIAPPFFNSALDRGEWLVSRACRFTLGKGTSDTHWIGGWLDPRSGLDAVEWRKVLASVGNRTPTAHSVAHSYTN